MVGIEHIKVEPDEAGMRLDRWFKVHFPGLGFGPLQKLLRSGQVRVDGGRVKSDARVQPGQMVRVPPLDVDAKLKTGPIAGKDLKHSTDFELLSRMVLHEDDKVIVLNKPPGLAVQGGSGVTRHIDQMLDAWTSPKGEKPRLVHRLDRDTSGVLVIARTRGAAQKLTAAFRERDTKKTYWSLVKGVPRKHEDKISTWLVKEQTATAIVCALPSTAKTEPITRYLTTALSRRQPSVWHGWRWSPIPAARTSFVSMRSISAIRSSAIRNISTRIQIGISLAAFKSGCICTPAISTSRIPQGDACALPRLCRRIWCRAGTCSASMKIRLPFWTTKHETRAF